MPLYRVPIYHNVTYGTVIIVAAESESNFRIKMDTPYLVLTGELWGVYCEDFGEDLPRYDGNTLYKVLDHIIKIYILVS